MLTETLTLTPMELPPLLVARTLLPLPLEEREEARSEPVVAQTSSLPEVSTTERPPSCEY